MTKVTLIIAALLIALGLASFFGTGSQHYTALIPTWVGVALGIFGVLAISPNEKRRKIFMHINVTIGLLGFLAAAGRAVSSYGRARSLGVDPDWIAVGSQLAMAGLLLIYVVLCVMSFLDARRARDL